MSPKFGYSIWGAAESQVRQRIQARGAGTRPAPPIMNYEQFGPVAEEDEAQERSDPYFSTPVILFIIGLLVIRVTWTFVMLARGNDFRDLFSFLVF